MFSRAANIFFAIAIAFATSCGDDISKTGHVGPIDAKDISDWIYLLADDSMQGRYTPSPELENAAVLIANNFREIGLESGVPDNTYIQRYPLPKGSGSEDAPNVVGILPGSDPKLKEEYVVFSAHMDHIGVSHKLTDDNIFNGADDNASGTSAVIAIAKTMSLVKPGPRRSMIFLLVSGEERGLWGSRWFTAHPPIPINSIVADINIDVIGRNQADNVVAVGKYFSTLGDTVDIITAMNPWLGLAVIDDPWPEEHLFYRSDHYSFAVKGIPAICFTGGTHEDYHRPSDEADKINFENVVRTAQLIALTGFEVANAQERPRWDKNAYNKIVRRPQ